MGERDVRGCPVTVTDLDVKDALTLFKKFLQLKRVTVFQTLWQDMKMRLLSKNLDQDTWKHCKQTKKQKPEMTWGALTRCQGRVETSPSILSERFPQHPELKFQLKSVQSFNS